MAKLLITLPNSRKVVHEVSGDVVTVGRSADNKIQINHDSVSGHHAKFILTKGRYRLKDLDSTNKTCINGLPVSEAVLSGSSILRFGTVECMFKEEVAGQSETVTNPLAEAQRQIAALMRARDALHEQNLQVAKQRDTLQISIDELSDKISDIEKEKALIAKERDALAAGQKDLPAKPDGSGQQIQSLQHQRDEARQSVEALSARVNELQQQLDTLLGERESARRQSDETIAKLGRQGEQLDAAAKEREALQKIEKKLREQLAEAHDRNASSAKEHAEAVEAKSNSLNEVETLRVELQEARAAFEKSTAELGEAGKRIEELSKNQEVQSGEVAARLTEAGKQIEVLTQKSESLAAQLVEATQEKSSSLNEVETLRVELQEARAAFEKSTAELGEAGKRIEELSKNQEAQNGEAAARLTEAGKQIEALTQTSQNLAAQLAEERQSAECAAREGDAKLAEMSGKLGEVQTQLEAVQAQYKAEKKAHVKLSVQLSKAEEKSEHLIQERDAAAAQARAKLEEAAEQIEALKMERELARETAAQLAEAKQRVHQLMSERDAEVGSISDELDQARKQIESLKTEHESALQSSAQLAAQLGESKEQAEAIRKEHEAAAGANDKLAAQLAEARQQIDSLSRELETRQNEATRKIDEAEKRARALASELDAAKKSGDENAARILEAEGQIEATRLERDGLQEKNEDLSAQLAASRKQIDEIIKRGGAEAGEIASRLDEAQKQIEAMARERDDAKHNGERLVAELEATKQRIEELARNQGAEADEIACKLSEAQKQIDMITRERDSAKQAGERLAAELEATKQHFDQSTQEREAEFAGRFQETQNQIAAIGGERDSLLHRNQELQGSLETVQQQFAAQRAAQEAAHHAHTQELAAQAGEEKRRTEQLAKESETKAGEFAGQLAEAHQQIAALAKQNQDLLGELNAHREKLKAAEAGNDAAGQTREDLLRQIEEAKGQIVELVRNHEAAIAAEAEKFREAKNDLEAIRFERATLQQTNEDLTGRIETQREQIAALRGQRGAARRDGRKAEGEFNDVLQTAKASAATQPSAIPINGRGLPFRLAGDSAKAENTGLKTGKSDSPKAAAQESGAAKSEPPAPLNLRQDRKSASVGAPAPDESEVRSILPAVPQIVATIRSSLQYFIRHQDDQNLIQQLYRSAQSITEKTSHIKAHPVHRLSVSIESLLRDFVKFREQINSGTLRSLGLGLEALATLLDEKNLFRASQLPPAKVFAVDDNADVVREIASAAMLVKTKVSCADTPKKALASLDGHAFDLIFLDINLPEMSGLELCMKVRSLPDHRKTPIVFITGDGTPENRAQSLLRGGNDFIAKPFDLSELNVKMLSWVFKGQLELT